MIYLFSLISLYLSKPIQLEFSKPGRNSYSSNGFGQAAELPLYNDVNDQMLAELCLGTPSQCFKVIIDTGSVLLWVGENNCRKCKSKNLFNPYISNTFNNMTYHYSIKYGTGAVNGYLGHDKISFNDISIDKLKFLVVLEQMDFYGSDGIVGLGYDYTDIGFNKPKEFSFIDQLYEQGKINKRIFSQKYHSDSSGVMVIGDYPDEVVNDKDNYATCDVIPNFLGSRNFYWHCNLRGIFFGFDNVNDTIAVNKPALLDTGTNIIVVDYDFFIDIADKYLKEYINSRQCWVIEEQNNLMYQCVRNLLLNSLRDVNFVFGNYAMKMEPNDLFYIDSNDMTKIRLIITSNKSRSTNEWIIGEPLLKKFHMVFDKEEGKVGFYGGSKYNVDIPFPNPYAGMLIFAFIMFCIAVGVLIGFSIWKYYQAKRNVVVFYHPNMYIERLRGNI